MTAGEARELMHRHRTEEEVLWGAKVEACLPRVYDYVRVWAGQGWIVIQCHDERLVKHLRQRLQDGGGYETVDHRALPNAFVLAWEPEFRFRSAPTLASAHLELRCE